IPHRRKKHSALGKRLTYQRRGKAASIAETAPAHTDDVGFDSQDVPEDAREVRLKCNPDRHKNCLASGSATTCSGNSNPVVACRASNAGYCGAMFITRASWARVVVCRRVTYV